MKFNSKTVVVLIVIVGLAFGLIFRNSFFNEIEKNKVETVGKVYRIRHVAGSTTGKKIYEYEFEYEGKNYSGEVRKRISDSIEIGDFYKVKLSSNRPENNMMEFETEYVQVIRKNENGIPTDTIFELKKN